MISRVKWKLDPIFKKTMNSRYNPILKVETLLRSNLFKSMEFNEDLKSLNWKDGKDFAVQKIFACQIML